MKALHKTRICFFYLVCTAALSTTFADEPLSVETLMRQLETGDDDTRRVAARSLAELGAEARSAVAVLSKAAHDRDRQVASQSLEALATLGPEAKDATNSLVELLESSDDQLRYRAAYALGRIGPAAVEPLKNLLAESGNDRARAAAIRAVGWMGPSAESVIPELIVALGNDGQLGELAAKALGQIGEPGVEPLVVALDSQDPKTRSSAATSLGLIGHPAELAASKLSELSHDQDDRVRVRAVEAYGRVTGDSADAMAGLSATLADVNPEVRQTTAAAMLRKPESLNTALPTIQQMLDRGPEDVVLAGLLLGRIGPEAIIAMDRMFEAVRRDRQNQTAMSAVIGQFGSDAVETIVRNFADGRIDQSFVKEIFERMGDRATVPLCKVIENAELKLKCAAITALGSVRPVETASVDLLIRNLASPEAELRMAAAQGIANMEAAGQTAQVELRKATSDLDERVRSAATVALFRIGIDPSQLSETILSGLKNESTEVRRESVRALARFEALEPRHVEALGKLLDDLDSGIRAGAVLACQRVRDADESLVRRIANMLDDADAQVRLSALSTLGGFGTRGAPIVGRLCELLTAGDEPTQVAILETLGRIGHGADSVRAKVAAFLEHDSAVLRAKSIESLSRIISDRAAFMKIAIHKLDDQDWSVRREVAGLLGEEGEKSVSAVPKLIARMRVPEDSEFARDALQAIDAAPPEAVPLLIEVLNADAPPRHRRIAVFLLKKAGPEAKQAIPVLRKMLENPDLEGRARSAVESAISDIEKL